MLDKKRQDAIDAATKKLYDYIDSLPPGKREKALKYQAMLVRKASESQTGMLEVCASELKRLNEKFVSALKSLEKDL